MKSELKHGGDINPKDLLKMLIWFTIGINAYAIFMLIYNTITYGDFSFIHLFGIIGMDVAMYYILSRLYHFIKGLKKE